MKFRVLFLFFSVLSAFALKAQHYPKARQNTSFIKTDTTSNISEAETSKNNIKTTFFNSRTYTFSYFGNNLVNPGIKAAINFTLTEKTAFKSKTAKNGKKKDKTATNQFLTSAHIGFFWQPESHIGTFNFYEVTYKRIKREDNSYFRIGLGPGFYRSFYPQTFEMDETGTVSEVAMGGRSYFTPVITFGTGKIRDKGYLHSITFATNLMFLFNYNSGIVPLLNLEIDFCFDFKK